MYKWSEFNVVVSNGPGKILKNLSSGQVVQFTEAYSEYLHNVVNGLVPNGLTEFFDPMEQMGFIVPFTLDEGDDFIHQFHSKRTDMSKLSIVWVPTMKCQMRCEYCFQDNFHTGNKMSSQTADMLIRKMRQHFNNFPQCKKLEFEIFGGEPALAWDVVEYTMPKVAGLCDEFGVVLETSIISNTEFFDLSKAKFLSKFNWVELQTTFEGPRDIHDRIRIPQSGKSTFDTILNNFGAILNSPFAPGIMKARCHFYSDTVSRVSELFDLFVEKGFVSNPKFRVVLQEVQSTQGNDIKPLQGIELAQAYLQLFREQMKRNIAGVPYTWVDGPLCYEKRPGAWMVAPNGVVESCDSRVGMTSGFAHLKNEDLILNDQPDTNFRYLFQCNEEKCPQRPVCGGSCTYNAMVETGEWFQRWCRRDFLTAMNELLIRLWHIEYPNYGK